MPGQPGAHNPECSGDAFIAIVGLYQDASPTCGAVDARETDLREVLVIDVGGSHIRVFATGRKTPIKIPSGPTMTAGQIGRRVREAIDGWTYDPVSIGLPRSRAARKPMSEPRNLKGRTYEDYVGKAGLKRFGKKKWRRHALDVVTRLRAALEADDVVIGGGNAKLLKRLPRGVRLGANANAFLDGYRLWNKHA